VIYLLMLVFVLSLALTGVLRRYALAKNIMDIPNQRSSHRIPTPRGGGVAFVMGFLIAVPCLAYQGYLLWSESSVIISAGFFVAALGFFDDRGHIDVRLRLLGHLAAGGFVVVGLGGIPSITVFAWTIPAGLLLNFLAVIYLVWLLNLYNFMDGIDGIASVEAVSVCLSVACLYWLSGHLTQAYVPLALAAGVCGFLYWNIPPARIFMGDAGSGFLGFMLGVLSLQASMVHAQFLWSWLILLGVFVVDATITIVRRGLRGVKIYEAHCSHAYQHATSQAGKHARVTMAVVVINMVWLFPMALLVGLDYVNGCLGCLIAYAPLILLAFYFKAGK